MTRRIGVMGNERARTRVVVPPGPRSTVYIASPLFDSLLSLPYSFSPY